MKNISREQAVNFTRRTLAFGAATVVALMVGLAAQAQPAPAAGAERQGTTGEIHGLCSLAD